MGLSQPARRRNCESSDYWLDPITMSFLLSSRLDLSLHRILGESPVILPTAVFADAKELVDRFGSPVDANATVLKDYVSIGLESPKAAENDWELWIASS